MHSSNLNIWSRQCICLSSGKQKRIKRTMNLEIKYYNFNPKKFSKIFYSILDQLAKWKNKLWRLKYTIILKWSFLIDHIKMTVHFIKNDDLILFHFNMKKLNMFNFLHIKMMKISFEIIRHHCLVLATRNLLTTIYISIYLNKNESLAQRNLKII